MASKGKAPETKNLLPKSDGDAKGAAAPAADGGADGGDKKNAKLDQVEQQVKDTQAKLQQTIQSAMQRGDAIDSLEEKSNQMRANASKFKEVGHQVRMEFCKRHYRTVALVVAILAVIGVVIYLIAR